MFGRCAEVRLLYQQPFKAKPSSDSVCVQLDLKQTAKMPSSNSPANALNGNNVSHWCQFKALRARGGCIIQPCCFPEGVDVL